MQIPLLSSVHESPDANVFSEPRQLMLEEAETSDTRPRTNQQPATDLRTSESPEPEPTACLSSSSTQSVQHLTSAVTDSLQRSVTATFSLSLTLCNSMGVMWHSFVSELHFTR